MASYQHLLWTPTHQGPNGLFGLMWLSLPHLVYNPLSNSVRSSTPLARRTQPSYIIVRRPPDLWNRMFNRHQAEITVMQFRGHSLPVHHSVVAQWDLHLDRLLSALIRPRDLFRLLAFGMCHLHPVHHLGRAFLGRVEGQNITKPRFLWTERSFVNKRKHSRGWSEIVGVMKWYMQMLTLRSVSVGVSVSLESDPAYSHWESPLGSRSPQQSLVEYAPPDRKAEEALSEVLKITQHGMVKRRKSNGHL